jgi:hypothetical protein
MKEKYIDKYADYRRVYFEDEIYAQIYISGEASKYSVSNRGNVINNKTGKFIKPHYDGKYYTVRLTHHGKTKSYKLHRLVAKYFIPNNDESKNQVNHKNGLKCDNCFDNLEYTTGSENMIHSVLNGLKPKTVVLKLETVHEICRLIALNKFTASEIADIVGCSKYNVKNIKSKAAWSYISNQYF